MLVEPYTDLALGLGGRLEIAAGGQLAGDLIQIRWQNVLAEHARPGVSVPQQRRCGGALRVQGERRGVEARGRRERVQGEGAVGRLEQRSASLSGQLSGVRSGGGVQVERRQIVVG